MKKVLFSHSYYLRYDPKQWETGQPYAPLGTLYAAALLKKNGYETALHDTMFSTGPDELKPVLTKEKPAYFVVYDDGFNYLTKMCLTNMREAAFQMIAYAKQAGARVIVASSDAADHSEKYLEAGADFVLAGEAEQTLLELLNVLETNEDGFLSIAGLVYKTGEAVIRTGRREVMRNLDELPWPLWDLVDIRPYREMWMKSSGYFSINMATTRGCPFKCNWCAKPIYGNRYNSRSPEDVVKELVYLKQKFSFDHVWFCDDIFGLKPGWVPAFADAAEKAGLQIPFKIQARVDLMVQENYILDLKRAGCATVWMGAESGSQRILDAMDKGTTVEQIYKAAGLLKKNGIKPCFFIQFGYPGETKEDIKKTIRMIRELLPAELGVSVSYPLPGTLFYEKVKAQLQDKSNWTDSDELALMFRNTYQPAFYKQLHRYVHRTYRLHLAFDAMKQIIVKPFGITGSRLKKALSAFYYAPAAACSDLKLQWLQRSHV